MTREKWATMSSDERRIKVAELCGWRRQGDIDVEFFWWHPGLCPAGSLVVCYNFPPARGLPEYLNDLNAMHEAEKIIISKKVRRNQVVPRGIYESMLIDATGGFAWCATAAQRAEAFVLTLEPEIE